MAGTHDPGAPIRKNEGVTPTERFLGRLAEKTFLSLWSYPGLFRAPGVELCDLLVVFDRDCIVFSDKHCAFPNSANLLLDWNRWFDRAVRASTKQALRAERWIRQHPDRIYLNARCTKAFHLDIPPSGMIQPHVIVVAHGGSSRCKELLGGSGSLMINSGLRGKDAHTEPFAIGDLNPGGPFVHVFDDTTLGVLLDTTDTIADFTAYLRKKESLLRSPVHVVAAGEEELLAVFLKNMNDKGEHDFVFPPGHSGVAIAEGHWEAFHQHPQRRAQLDADRISYAWDRLIETFSTHALAGTQYTVWPAGLKTTERIVRIMAAEPRLRRRMLAKALFDILDTTPPHLRRIRVVTPSRPGDPYYALVLVPFQKQQSYEENRRVRAAYLEACCLVVKHVYPDALDIVGIATESGRNDTGSEDAVYLDARVWTEAMARQAAKDQKEWGILVAPTFTRGTETEYPDP